MEISKRSDINEITEPCMENYKEIKPEGKITPEEAEIFWTEKMEASLKEADNISDYNETEESDKEEQNIEKIKEEYIADIKERSECPETIPDNPFEVSDLEKITPEKNAERREEFGDSKQQLKKAWEEIFGREWPKCEEDVYSENGKLLRKKGSDYDAHHIQPLGMGGKNEATNITPLHVEQHYDKKGIHSPDSPYSKLNELLGGENQ